MFVLKSIFFVILLLVFTVQIKCTNELEEKFNRLIDVEWQCETICVGSGGQAKFLPEYKICKCWIENYIDDADLQLMLKNARTMGLKLITVEPIRSRQSNHIKKREISPPTKFDELMNRIHSNPIFKNPNLKSATTKKPLPSLPKIKDQKITENINKLKARLAEQKQKNQELIKSPMLKSRNSELKNKNWKRQQELKSIKGSEANVPHTETASKTE